MVRRMVFLGSITKTVRICNSILQHLVHILMNTSLTHRERETLLVNIRCILLVQHIVQGSDFPVFVCDLHGYTLNRAPEHTTRTTYDGVLHIGRTELCTIIIDVLHPFLVRLEAIGREADDLHAALSKILRPPSNLPELSRADGCEVVGV